MIKGKLMLGITALLAIAGVMIKVLLMRNKAKDEKIDTLEQNAVVKEKVHKVDINRAKFEAKQEQKVKDVNDESELDVIDEKRGKVDEKDNDDDDWSTVTK